MTQVPRDRRALAHASHRHARELFRDEQTDQPEWAAVRTGLFGTKLSFVPIQNAELAGESVRVPFSKEQIKGAPKIDDSNGELSQQEESELYEHYGMSYGESRSDTGLPEGGAPAGDNGHDTSGPTTDEAMTRSEEELKVGKAERESGRARLRKYVVTEEVQQTVPVRREEVRVEREPITDANADQALDGPAISEEEHEVVLHEEEPVVEKRAVPEGAGADAEGRRHRRGAGLGGGPQGADRGRGRRRPLAHGRQAVRATGPADRRGLFAFLGGQVQGVDQGWSPMTGPLRAKRMGGRLIER